MGRYFEPHWLNELIEKKGKNAFPSVENAREQYGYVTDEEIAEVKTLLAKVYFGSTREETENNLDCFLEYLYGLHPTDRRQLLEGIKEISGNIDNNHFEFRYISLEGLEALSRSVWEKNHKFKPGIPPAGWLEFDFSPKNPYSARENEIFEEIPEWCELIQKRRDNLDKSIQELEYDLDNGDNTSVFDWSYTTTNFQEHKGKKRIVDLEKHYYRYFDDLFSELLTVMNSLKSVDKNEAKETREYLCGIRSIGECTRGNLRYLQGKFSEIAEIADACNYISDRIIAFADKLCEEKPSLLYPEQIEYMEAEIHKNKANNRTFSNSWREDDWGIDDDELPF